MSFLPNDAGSRKGLPICTGVFDYFPRALAAISHLSKVGNDQHNPGQPLHWAKGKSTDHADCLARHLLERGAVDVDGVRHSTKVAWRALALLETELGVVAAEGEKQAAAQIRGAQIAAAADAKQPEDWTGRMVHCIDNSGRRSHLDRGKCYVVDYGVGNSIRVFGSDLLHRRSRFELAEPHPDTFINRNTFNVGPADIGAFAKQAAAVEREPWSPSNDPTCGFRKARNDLL